MKFSRLKTLLLYLVIRGKLLLGYTRDALHQCSVFSDKWGHKGTSPFQRWWSLCKSLPRITRYSNSVFSLENFNCYVNKQSNNSVYQILFKFYLQKAYFPHIHSTGNKLKSCSNFTSTFVYIFNRCFLLTSGCLLETNTMTILSFFLGGGN